MLDWTTEPLDEALDVAGDIEVELHATATAIDTAWFVTLQDVTPDGSTTDVTAGTCGPASVPSTRTAALPGRP